MNKLLYPLIFTFICLFITVGYSQPAGLVYAGAITSGGTFQKGGLLGNDALGAYSFSNLTASVDNSSLTDFTTLFARNDALTTATAYIQLTFGGTVPANSTIYVKTTLAAMSFLQLGGITLSYINSSGVSAGITDYKTYYTGDGNVYFAIKPSNILQSLKITITSAAALGGSMTMDVYYAFYGSNAPNDSDPSSLNVADCGSPIYTTFSTSGITVGSFGVSNPGRAIDSDAAITMSSFYATGLSVLGGKISQTFYFNGLSNPKDAVRIVFSRSASLVAVDLAKSITISAYNGGGTETAGVPVSIFSLLDVAVLNLQIGTNTTPLTAYYAPRNSGGTSQIFDRIVVEVDIALLGVSLGGNGLNILDIRRVPDVPTAFDALACTNVGNITLSASFSQESLAGFTYKWYNAVSGGTLLESLIGKTPLITGLTLVGQSNYYVDVTKSGCTVPSGRTKVTVNTVNPPTVPPVALVP